MLRRACCRYKLTARYKTIRYNDIGRSRTFFSLWEEPGLAYIIQTDHVLTTALSRLGVVSLTKKSFTPPPRCRGEVLDPYKNCRRRNSVAPSVSRQSEPRKRFAWTVRPTRRNVHVSSHRRHVQAWGVSEFRMADIGNFDAIISNRV